MVYNYKGEPVFADPDGTVRIWDGANYEGAFQRHTEGERIDLTGEGPFVLLSDYQALHNRVYGKTENTCNACGTCDEVND